MLSFISSFDTTQLLALSVGLMFLLLSTVTQYLQKDKLTFIFVGICAFGVFSFAALLDPFLNLWDERFHALVAKNLMEHPLMPTLFENPIINFNSTSWVDYHIWLHKQPLFLWQIALSFQLFGVSEFTLRLPSIILGTVFVLITYRSAKLIFNQRVGYFASILIISSYYILELISGRQELEHNDISFLTYVSLSIWAFIEYYYSKNRFWIYLIGAFSGAAILCKWLVGLLVYAGWFTLRILGKKFKISENYDILSSLLVTLAIALPWQILTFLWYPNEAASALKFNSLHFSKVIEGHGGGFWYHFNLTNEIFGPIASYLIIPALIVCFLQIKNAKNLLISLVTMVVVVFAFFTLAATKMPSFTLITSMTVFIALAVLLDFVLAKIKFKPFKNPAPFGALIAITVITLFVVRIDFNKIQKTFAIEHPNNEHSRMLIHNKNIFKSLDLPENTVIYNVNGLHNIEAMFYTGLTAYKFIPSEKDYNYAKAKGYGAAIFIDNKTELPPYLKNDSTLIPLHFQLKGYR